MFKDRCAINLPIVIGNTYGYSTSDSGRISVVVGRARKITPTGKVTIDIEYRREFLYGEEINTYPGADSVHVHPAHLFPIHSPEEVTENVA